MMIMSCCNVQINEYDIQAKTYPTICTHHKLHKINENKLPYFSALAPLSIPIICQLNQDIANKTNSLHDNSKLDC